MEYASKCNPMILPKMIANDREFRVESELVVFLKRSILVQMRSLKYRLQLHFSAEFMYIVSLNTHMKCLLQISIFLMASIILFDGIIFSVVTLMICGTLIVSHGIFTNEEHRDFILIHTSTFRRTLSFLKNLSFIN